MDIWVSIELRNPRSIEIPFTVTAGAVFEVDASSGVQNVVIENEHHFVVQPKASVRAVMLAHCLNPGRDIPNHVVGRVTPFRFAGNSTDQSVIWDAARRPTP